MRQQVWNEMHKAQGKEHRGFINICRLNIPFRKLSGDAVPQPWESVGLTEDPDGCKRWSVMNNKQ
jgi:hypothetical protein